MQGEKGKLAERGRDMGAAPRPLWRPGHVLHVLCLGIGAIGKPRAGIVAGRCQDSAVNGCTKHIGIPQIRASTKLIRTEVRPREVGFSDSLPEDSLPEELPGAGLRA